MSLKNNYCHPLCLSHFPRFAPIRKRSVGPIIIDVHGASSSLGPYLLALLIRYPHSVQCCKLEKRAGAFNHFMHHLLLLPQVDPEAHKLQNLSRTVAFNHQRNEMRLPSSTSPAGNQQSRCSPTSQPAPPHITNISRHHPRSSSPRRCP